MDSGWVWGGSHVRIVVIDYDKQCLAHLKTILEQINPDDEALIFNEAFDALEYIKKNGVDEVFIEVGMPKMTGFALTKAIKKVDKKIRVILLARSKEYAIEAWKVHANYFLVKPVTLESVLKMRE